MWKVFTDFVSKEKENESRLIDSHSSSPRMGMGTDSQFWIIKSKSCLKYIYLYLYMKQVHWNAPSGWLAGWLTNLVASSVRGRSGVFASMRGSEEYKLETRKHKTSTP